MPESLASLLRDDSVKFIGRNHRGDNTRLENMVNGKQSEQNKAPVTFVNPASFVDVAHEAFEAGLAPNRNQRLDVLCESILGKRMDKGAALSAWETPLHGRPDLQQYCALDVAVTSALHEKLRRYQRKAIELGAQVAILNRSRTRVIASATLHTLSETEGTVRIGNIYVPSAKLSGKRLVIGDIHTVSRPQLGPFSAEHMHSCLGKLEESLPHVLLDIFHAMNRYVRADHKL